MGGAAACLPSLAREDLSDAFRKDTRALSDALTKYMTLVRTRPLAVSFLPLTFPLVACTAARWPPCEALRGAIRFRLTLAVHSLTAVCLMSLTGRREWHCWVRSQMVAVTAR